MEQALKRMHDREAALAQDFEVLLDWEDRYAYIIELGQSVDFDLCDQVDANLVEGCQSRVWLKTTYEQGRLSIKATSDALLVRGLLAIVMRIFDGMPPAAILAFSFDSFDRFGLSAHLTPARNNGVHAVHQAIKAHASACLA